MPLSVFVLIGEDPVSSSIISFSEAASSEALVTGRRDGREAEGGGLLNRYRTLKFYRGFESLSLRHHLVSN
jgi:hypothetical protein